MPNQAERASLAHEERVCVWGGSPAEPQRGGEGPKPLPLLPGGLLLVSEDGVPTLTLGGDDENIGSLGSGNENVHRRFEY